MCPSYWNCYIAHRQIDGHQEIVNHFFISVPNNFGRFGGGETSLIDGVFGKRNCLGMKGLINFLWDGDVREVLLLDLTLFDNCELDSSVISVNDGVEDLELELERDIVSVQSANLK